jgi:hypothetical protein
MNKLPIYVEGNLDKLIVSKIIDLISLQSSYQIKKDNFFVDQTNGINEVFKKLNKSKTTCIGLIDNDKRKSNSFNNYHHCGSYNKLKIYYMNENNIHHFLLVFDPASEKWVIDSAVSIGLNSDFPILNDLKAFSKITKSRERIIEIEDLIKKIFFNNSLNSVLFRRIIFGIYKRYI